MRDQFPLSMIVLALACTACNDRDAANDTASPSAATMAMPATTAPVTTSLPPAATVVPPSGVMPAQGAITFAGFGPAHWGASEEQVRQAWGKDMDGAPTEPDGCFYLFPEPRTNNGFRFAFMVEGGKLGRIDVRTPDIVAPGGGKVGMGKEALHRMYPGLAEQRDKYDENARNLRGTDPQGGPGVIVFAVDASGNATAWRVGVPPQVDYVEGCS